MIEDAQKLNQARKLKKAEETQNHAPDSDETFAYIVGYTSNGVPYGVTWEEMDELERQ